MKAGLRSLIAPVWRWALLWVIAGGPAMVVFARLAGMADLDAIGGEPGFFMFGTFYSLLTGLAGGILFGWTAFRTDNGRPRSRGRRVLRGAVCGAIPTALWFVAPAIRYPATLHLYLQPDGLIFDLGYWLLFGSLAGAAGAWVTPQTLPPAGPRR